MGYLEELFELRKKSVEADIAQVPLKDRSNPSSFERIHHLPKVNYL